MNFNLIKKNYDLDVAGPVRDYIKVYPYLKVNLRTLGTLSSDPKISEVV